MNNKKNRRKFLTQSASAIAGLGMAGVLSACASFDDFFFDDRGELTDEVVIIGGGISGLYFASLLRQKQIGFRLYESSPYLGGRIRSLNAQDLGASVLRKTDVLTNQLIDSLKLERTWIDKNQFYLQAGMQAMVDGFKDRILGLLPYYSYRVRWKLIEVSPLQNGYELVLQHSGGQKKISCRQLVLSLPPSQWTQVKGLLELPEMAAYKTALAEMKTENVIKFVLPISAVGNSTKSQVFIDSDNLQFRLLYKNINKSPHFEIDAKYLSKEQFSIDYIYNEMRRRLQLNLTPTRMASETSLNWAQISGIQGAYFKWSAVPAFAPQKNFHVIGDSTASEATYTIEGALRSASQAAARFI